MSPHSSPVGARIRTLALVIAFVAAATLAGTAIAVVESHLAAGVSFGASPSSAATATPVAAHTADATADPSAEVAYALAHWSDRNVARYGSLGDDDCVNFASQALSARGWPQTPEWWHSQIAGINRYSSAWISSTAFARYLSAHPELATPLTDDERSQVKPGDIVQFDWDDSGNRDHTGVVTHVSTQDGHTEVFYASHSNDRRDMSVDEAIALDGGTAYYWHLLQ
jgi:hypothetical protein